MSRGGAETRGRRALEKRGQQVIVELESVERLVRVHGKQLLTYLRLMNKRVGLLINFGGNTLMDGLHRVVNHLPPSASPRLRVNQSV